MSLNPDYILSPPIEQVFVDKDTGELLDDGYLLFFEDNSRSLPKKVYQITGAPPNYSFTEYGFLDIPSNGWRVNLTDTGVLDRSLYYFPFDINGDTQLYFIQCYSVGDILQFSREAFPGAQQVQSASVVSSSYVPNGQFLLHYDIPAEGVNSAGEITQPITTVAQGGWTFERPALSTAKDIVTFQRFGSAVTVPASNPRYAVRVECQAPDAGDIFKDLRIRFDDVNKFSSDTDFFTFGFSAESNSGTGFMVQLILIKNFGTGGSATTERVLRTFTLSISYQPFSFAFVFGNNLAKTLGLLDDDYLQLALRFPTDNVFDCSITDAFMAKGNISNALFPYTPDGQMVIDALGNGSAIQPSTGFDLYLPILNGPTGIYFDSSQIGKIFGCVYEIPGINELLADGSKYLVDGFSAVGIPYARLYEKLVIDVTGISKYGTGNDFIKVHHDPTYVAQLDLSTNISGPQTATADGGTATGFTFTQISTGFTSGITCYGLNSSDTIQTVLDFYGPAFAAPTNGTSGFTLTEIQNPFSNSSPTIKTITNIQVIAAVGLAGKYFTLASDILTAIDFAFWFKVDGVGVAPVLPGKTLIEVDLLSTWLAPEVALAVLGAVNAWQQSIVVTKAGTLVPPSSYFNFTANAIQYFVWYKVDGVGVAPNNNLNIAIEVDILSTDTAEVVGTKTQTAINSKYFAVPDYRGVFLRGWNNTAFTDPGVRVSNVPWLPETQLGNFEFSGNLGHDHTELASDGSAGVGGFYSTAITDTYHTGYAGIQESRPLNSSVNYVIKY